MAGVTSRRFLIWSWKEEDNIVADSYWQRSFLVNLPPHLCFQKKHLSLVRSFRLANGISSLEFSNNMTESLKTLKRIFQFIHQAVGSSVSWYMLAMVMVKSSWLPQTEFIIVYGHLFCSLHLLFALIKAHLKSKFSLEKFSCFFHVIYF